MYGPLTPGTVTVTLDGTATTQEAADYSAHPRRPLFALLERAETGLSNNRRALMTRTLPP